MSTSATNSAPAGTSVFTEINLLAAQHNAINLGQGFPDFAAPEFIKQAAAAAILADQNQYAPSPGLPELRQAIAEDWAQEYALPVDWQLEVTITSGATEALYAATRALLAPGDKAIVLLPAFDVYVPDIQLAGAQPLPVPLRPPDWQIDWRALEEAFAQRPRAIIINTPHNPVGKVFSHVELSRIAELCCRYDVVALSDEVYSRLLYHDATHIPIATLPDMWERTLTIGSIGKMFSVTGWKIGYAIGPAWLTNRLRQVHQWLVFSTPTPLQYAAAAALGHARAINYYTALRASYDERRIHLAAALQGAGLQPLPIQGGIFFVVDVSTYGFPDDQTFCKMLTADVGVAAVPLSAFYAGLTTAPSMVRFCFAKRPETLRAAEERLTARLRRPG